jgi:hypothetical protein
LQRGVADVGADGADFATSDALSIQSFIRSTSEVTMDIWKIILAVAQVAGAAKHEEVQVLFERVEKAPMVRFNVIRQVFPDARYGHIVVACDMALLGQEIKELQQGISYRRQRATVIQNYSNVILYYSNLLFYIVIGRSWLLSNRT